MRCTLGFQAFEVDVTILLCVTEKSSRTLVFERQTRWTGTMKIDFSVIPGGRRSWATVGLVFFLGLLLFILLALVGYHFSTGVGWLWQLSIPTLVVIVPLERHWGERRALFSVWMLSVLAILASYGVFLVGYLILDSALTAELF